jgi:hypothetical protein
MSTDFNLSGCIVVLVGILVLVWWLQKIFNLTEGNLYMKPEWLQCKFCLLYVDGQCRKHFKGTAQDFFCSEWICSKCWSDWNDFESFKSNEDNDEWLSFYIDHTKCKPVEFK